jgi:hypothetical protein
MAGSRKPFAARRKISHAHLNWLTVLRIGPLVPMRSADAIEGLSHDHLPAIVTHNKRVIRMARQAAQQEVRHPLCLGDTGPAGIPGMGNRQLAAMLKEAVP